MSVLLLLFPLLLVWENPVTAREITLNTNGNDTEDCLEGDYPCSSLGYVLNHLQSNDCVNTTSSSVPLTTIVELHNLNAITIRGQGNTIVMCNNTGGVSCNNCSNVVIEGITWDKCGDPTTQTSTGGLTFTNITNLLITNCVLENSKVRALYLHLVAGVINITNTQMVNNANFNTMFCFDDQSGSGCIINDNMVTGGLHINEAFAGTYVYISDCTFANNGQFSGIINTNVLVEATDGAAVKILTSDSAVPLNITIEHTTFSSNCDGAVNINTSNSPSIQIHKANFLNNYVVQSSVNSSALLISTTTAMATLNVSFCNFINNSNGRNVLGFVIARQPAHLIVSNCNIIENTMYEIGTIELDVQSQSVVDILHSMFHNNTGNALFHFHMLSNNLSISLYDIQAFNNYGMSAIKRGGLLVFQVSHDHCIVNVTKLNFTTNTFVRDGGGLYICGNFQTSFKFYLQDSTFTNNIGRSVGTMIYTQLRSDNPFLFSIYNTSFVDNSGGTTVVRIIKRSLSNDLTRKLGLLFLGKSTKFVNNFGGSLSITSILIVGNGYTTFHSNTARDGSAVYFVDSYLLSNVTSFHLNFFHNFAFSRGGAIYVNYPSNVNITECNWLMYIDRNSLCSEYIQVAESCPVVDGRLLCSEMTATKPIENATSCNFNFSENSASLSGNAIFYAVPELPAIENPYDQNSIFYTPSSRFCFNSNHTKDVSTQPFQIRLKEPAKCIDTDCVTYYITDIMLGEVIEIPAQVVGYNNKSAESVVLVATCEDNCTTSNGSTNYLITGTIPVLISDKLGGIKITGIQNGPPLKLHLFSVSLHFDLVVELIPCRSGYMYNKETMQCECYTTDDIVSCTPEPTIRRDYWFGMVDNTTTVSRCPYAYCNFRCREVSPGRFLLPSDQDDQCDSHRTGPACGSCDDGYTIPFDSVECINVDNCHPGYTVLVIIGVIAYWVIVIVIFFAFMLCVQYIQFKVGFLYGIVYYYSVVDVLLGPVVTHSDDLHSIVTIFAGTVFKLYPGFLYKLCLLPGMDTIDQYAIHYIHPLAMLGLIFVLSKIARYSKRFTFIMGKVASPIVCLILTLAYMPITNTSLQLLRVLRFADVDDTYTYLSPDMKYFTDRHVVYFVIAIMFELAIGIGLPLLLLVEPLISHKISFTRLRPLLDQFQGCYKDKFRLLAAIYLISRHVILIISNINFSNPYVEKYLQMVVCVALALSHHLLQPYKSNHLYKFDGVVLYTLLLVVPLQIVAVSNGFTTDSITGLAYGLYFFPLIVSIVFLLHYIYMIRHTDNTQQQPIRQESMASTRKASTVTQFSYVSTNYSDEVFEGAVSTRRRTSKTDNDGPNSHSVEMDNLQNTL